MTNGFFGIDFSALNPVSSPPHPYVVRLRIANLLAAGKVADAEQASAAAAKDFPGSRALLRQRAEVLNAAKKWDESIALLHNETRLYKSDAELWRMLGEAYLAKDEKSISFGNLLMMYSLQQV